MGISFLSFWPSPTSPVPIPVFIELTDHLRCTANHAEQFLVLLPDEVRDRQVIRGSLGCPVCGRVVEVKDGIPRFGPPTRGSAPTALSAEAALVLLGITGPGGYVALVGTAGPLAAGLAELLPHVHFALINPPPGLTAASDVSILEADRIPLKTSSMRGVLVGRDFGDQPDWVRDASRAVLPGNRIVVEGPLMDGGGVEVVASAGGVWVGRK